jgi:hypothetical protein
VAKLDRKSASGSEIAWWRSSLQGGRLVVMLRGTTDVVQKQVAVMTKRAAFRDVEPGIFDSHIMQCTQRFVVHHTRRPALLRAVIIDSAVDEFLR